MVTRKSSLSVRIVSLFRLSLLTVFFIATSWLLTRHTLDSRLLVLEVILSPFQRVPTGNTRIRCTTRSGGADRAREQCGGDGRQVNMETASCEMARERSDRGRVQREPRVNHRHDAWRGAAARALWG